MNKIKKVIKAPVNFAGRHKIAITAVTTAAICIAINRNAISNYSDFIEAKGLTDEFVNFVV